MSNTFQHSNDGIRFSTKGVLNVVKSSTRNNIPGLKVVSRFGSRQLHFLQAQVAE